MMMVGRFLSTFITSVVSPRMQMNVACITAIVLLLVAQVTDDIQIHVFSANVPLSCLFIVLCGLCTAVMWAAIFNLATEDLGKYTAKASGIFMTMVVGGGIMPFIQESVLRPQVGYLGSYALVIAMLLYILYYSLWGSRNIDHELLAVENETNN
jgi:FHS family L-fucose permease-like MFS transporter